MISTCDYAWAGGFLEGEGCFALEKAAARSPFTRGLRISACQRKREPLVRLQEILGGSIATQSHGGKDMYVWRASGSKEVIRIVPMVLPWLCAKRVDAEIVLKFAVSVRSSPPRLTDAIKSERVILIEEMAQARSACLL